MMRFSSAAVLMSAAAWLAGVPSSLAMQGDRPGIPAALAAMADAERAFSARATEVGVRDAFIEFFADESISFRPGPGPARERLKQQPPPPPGRPAFTWEPRAGDVAASGDLGWLTGPVRLPQPDGSIRHGCYFSVWKKQADGSFKVILDEGINPPAEVPFAPGFVRSSAVAQPFAPRSGESAEASLMAADRALGEAIAAKGAASAFDAVMHNAVRVHRNGVLPMTSRADATKWLATEVKTMSSAPEKSEASAAGDLGYTWGQATVTGQDGKDRTGYYVRVWTRRADGGWQLVADVAQQ